MTELRSYHHGNLRAALIAAAQAVIRQHGHEAVSLRALADDLRVSRGAPYRHFADREALLAEVALDGFNTLDKLLKSIDAKPLPPSEKLYAASRQFLSFVRANPKIFRVMYETELLTRADSHPQLAQGLQHTYQSIDELLAQALPSVSTQVRKLRLIAMWSTLYGFAKIGQMNILQPYMKDGLTEDEIEMAVLQVAIGIQPKQA